MGRRAGGGGRRERISPRSMDCPFFGAGELDNRPRQCRAASSCGHSRLVGPFRSASSAGAAGGRGRPPMSNFRPRWNREEGNSIDGISLSLGRIRAAGESRNRTPCGASHRWASGCHPPVHSEPSQMDKQRERGGGEVGRSGTRIVARTMATASLCSLPTDTRPPNAEFRAEYRRAGGTGAGADHQLWGGETDAGGQPRSTGCGLKKDILPTSLLSGERGGEGV